MSTPTSNRVVTRSNSNRITPGTDSDSARVSITPRKESLADDNVEQKKQQKHVDDDSASPTTDKNVPTFSSNSSKNGLRVFSKKVAHMVESKGTSSYQEIADELVRDYVQEQNKGESGTPSEFKNIRRRAYDALNVLKAMGVISREEGNNSASKLIRWVGLPAEAEVESEEMALRAKTVSNLDRLKRERRLRTAEITRKRALLQQLLQQKVCYQNLTNFNQEQEKAAAENDDMRHKKKKQKVVDEHIPQEEQEAARNEQLLLPFIVINTSIQTMVGCKFGPDRTNASFNFSKPFEINDDNEILKMLGFNKAPRRELQKMLDKDIYDYCEKSNMLHALIKSAESVTFAPQVVTKTA